MSHPYDRKVRGTSINDNDVVCTTEKVTDCIEHTITCTAGTVDVEVSNDEELVAPPQAPTFSDSATFPIAVRLLNATAPGTWVTEVAAGQKAVLPGVFDRVRLKQKGVTASAAHISSVMR